MKRLFWILILTFLPCIGFAESAPIIGLTYSHSVIPKDPPNLEGYRVGFWYQPKSMIWEHFHVLFDLTFGHWHDTKTLVNRSLDSYAIAPIVRYYLFNGKNFSPFLNASIGLGYLSRTHIQNRKLGIHYTFQDQLGFGASFGPDKKFTIVANALHYSNGSMSARNSGITVPLVLTGEYAF